MTVRLCWNVGDSWNKSFSRKKEKISEVGREIKNSPFFDLCQPWQWSPQVRESGFRNPWGVFACGIRNPETFCSWNLQPWVLESGIQLKESGILLTIKIQNPSSTSKETGNPFPGIRNLRRRILNGNTSGGKNGFAQICSLQICLKSVNTEE